MGEPINAFGIFASERPEGAEELRWPGPQGYQDINLAFWQDRYYVKVLSLSERDTAAQWKLAKAVAERLPSGSGPPSELGLLPATNRLSGSERYVRQSALGHKFLERVVSAEYRLGKETAALHVADLRTPEEGEKAWRKLRDFASKVGKYFSPTEGAGEEGFVVRDSSLGLVIAARQGRYLVIATSPKATRATLLAFLKETVGKLSKERTAASLPCAVTRERL
jgi:hypothetical protein